MRCISDRVRSYYRSQCLQALSITFTKPILQIQKSHINSSEKQNFKMAITPLAIAFSEWGIGRFPLDLIIFLSVVLIFALPAGINRKKIFVEGDAFTTRFKS